MNIQNISPKTAMALTHEGASLIDIRDAQEFSREHIIGAKHIPISQLCDGKHLPANTEIIFYCKAGNRTRMNAALLLTAAGPNYKILEGGIDAWKAAGLPVRLDRKKPIEMMRQVQIAAGAMALFGAILGYAVAEPFYLLSGAVGAGLLFSGISGSCAMASLLRRMPWNRIAS